MFTIKNWEEYTYYLVVYLKNKDIAKFRSDFFQLHRNNQLTFFNTLDNTCRQTFYEFIQADEVANFFAKLNLTRKQLIVEEVNKEYMFALIDSLRTDEVVRYLSELEWEDIEYYLENMKVHDADQINTLLTYKPGTAGAMMATEYVTAYAHETIATILKRLTKIGNNIETIYYIYAITNTNQLIGVVSLRDLIVIPRKHTIGFAMKRRVIAVKPSTNEQDVVKVIKDYDLLLVPVITETNELIGIVTVDDVLDVSVDPTWRRIDLDILSSTSLRKQFLLIIAMFTCFILVTVIASIKLSIKATTLTISFALLVAGIAGIFSARSAIFTLHSLSKKQLNIEPFRLFLKDEFSSAFPMAIILGVMSSMIGFSFIENNDHLGILFGLTMFSAILFSVLAGALTPYLINKFKNYSTGKIISINTVVTSVICFLVTVMLFYIF